MNSLLRLGLTGLMVMAFAFTARALNNNGQTDILWRNPATTANDAWSMNGGAYSSTISLPATGGTDASSWKMIGTGDFNHDHQLDILWFHLNFKIVAIWFMNGNSVIGATDSAANPAALPYGAPGWTPTATGYFGGLADKDIDILWRHTDGSIALWNMNGPALASASLIYSFVDNNWKIGGTGDFNNDKNTDILWRHTLNSGELAVWFMSGPAWPGQSGLLNQANADQNWQIVGVDHFNSDNNPDILWRRNLAAAPEVALWYMNGTTFQNATLTGSRSLDWLVGGTGDSKRDSDADGLPDLWERNYWGFDISQQNGSGDPDGDGVTNAQEYAIGGNPIGGPSGSSISFEGAFQHEALSSSGVPDTMGAVDPNHFVEPLNNVVAVFNRHTGQRIATVTRRDFFRTSDGMHSGRADPRIVYDRDLQRWVAVAMDFETTDSLVFAISNGPDPVGNGATGWENAYWKKYAVVARAGSLRDFPTLGVDRNGIYVAVRVFGQGTPAVIIAIPKTAGFRNGSSDPDFQPLDLGPFNMDIDVIQPAVNFDAVSPTEPALFITQDRSAPASKVRVGRLAWIGSTAQISSLATWPSITLLQPGADLEKDSPSGSGTYPLNPYQLGSSVRVPIHTRGFGSRYTMAIIRHGFLWTSHSIGVNASGLYTGSWPSYGNADRVACEWLKFQIIPDGQLKTLQAVDYGRAYDSAGLIRFYYMPSLAVNARGDVLMGFSGSGVWHYIGAFYARRHANAPAWNPSDPSHKVNVATLQQGIDTYDIGLWGDYSYTCVDPNDDLTIWTVQEYARAKHLLPDGHPVSELGDKSSGVPAV